MEILLLITAYFFVFLTLFAIFIIELSTFLYLLAISIS